MPRTLLVLPFFALVAGASPAALFEAGLAYLRAGLYARARAAFAESLAALPAQPVPAAFLGVALAAERRPSRDAAAAFRRALALLPEGKTLAIDLREHLPSPRAWTLLLADHPPEAGRASLEVRAFLETMDGDPADAPALDALLRADPGDAYARALSRARTARPATPRPPP
jgi:tetratricopeptide (TPR) repeat protein